MRFVYSGLIFCDAEGFTTEKSTLRKTKKPVINGTINLNHKFLKTGVSLKRTDDPIIRSLYKDSENNELIWNCHHLKFSEIQLIREGKLSGLFSKMKLLKIFFNRRILDTVEIKYKAKTTLSNNSIFLSNGWSLFEAVTWGK